MRSPMVVAVLLAACLTSVVALAANDKRVASFQALAASGVSGEATLDPLPPGGTMLHGQIRGLQPNTTYISNIYTVDGACGSGTPSELVVTFTSNPNGIANWNKKVGQEIVDIRSVSVEIQSDFTVVACATVPQ